MNGSGRPDMLRSGIVQTPNMLALGNPPFTQNSTHLGQPQNPMGMPQNVNAANSAIPMLSGGPPQNQRYNLQPNPMQQQQQQQMQIQQRMLMRQGQNPQQLNPATGAPSGALIPTQLQGMPFPGNMMQQQGPNNTVRRVPSQSHLNSLTGMPSVASNMAMGMNPQTSMPAHLRQVSQQQQQHLRMQHQLQAGMSTDIGMGMNRQGPNPSLSQNMVARSNSAQAQQVMSSLVQPPPVQHSGGMPSHHQNFSNGGRPMTPQHQPLQLSSSPRPSSISQTHTPNMSMTTPHTPISRAQMTPDNSSPMFMYAHTPANSQSPGNNPSRIPPNSNAGSYSFVTPSTPPIQMDNSHPSPSNLIHPQGAPNRSAFLSTPAQQYELMNHSGVDLYGSTFGMLPPSGPPRPPSHNNPHQTPNQQQQQAQPLQSHQQQPHHQSPSQPEQPNIHPQRPLSQPQMPGRPPSQAGPPQTSRALQPPVNPILSLPGGLTATGRIPLAQQGQLTGQHHPIAPRPPSLSMASGPSLPTMPSAPITPSAHVPTDTPPSATSLVSRPIPSSSLLNLGSGQGLIRLLQFSGVLAIENKTKLQLSWWTDLIKEYFTPKAVMKLTLWKDNQNNEAKPFEIGVPILPRFFLVTTQSGVKSMTLSLDGARERIYGPGHSVVECVAAIWTYKYTNGYTVTLRGPLTTHVFVTTTHPPGNAQIPQYTLRFDDFQFVANFHEKYIALESIMGSRMLELPKTPRTRNTPTPTPTGTSMQVQRQLQQVEDDKKWEEPRVTIDRGSIPGEPVNAFGIPQATMRCLELAESVVAMSEIIVFSKDTELGPFDALKEFANKIRSTQGINSTLSIQPTNGLMANNNTSLSNTFQTFSSSSGLLPSTAPVTTLYSSAPASVTNPSPSANPPSSSSLNSPRNDASSSATNSPQKQPKTIPPQQQQQAQTPSQVPGPASSPAVSSGATTNTPAMSNTSLKRKQASDATSPAVGNLDQAPQKRVPRKRARGGTGGGP